MMMMMMMMMRRNLVLLLLFSTLVISGSPEFDHCNCDDDDGGFWSIHNTLIREKVSDFFIAIAYFSIPIEILYFINRCNVPFKLLFLEFMAFIILCGLTHLLTAYSSHAPLSYHLLLSLTVAKFLTALVSCATALTLPPLIPLLLKIKVREIFLKQDVIELGLQVGVEKKLKEDSLHVRMLTREIRKSLDKHTILNTTLVELSKALDLHNCAVWMPNEERREMYLTHELKPNNANSFQNSIPMNDLDVLEIRKSKWVKILRHDSALGAASSGGSGSRYFGAVAAVRMPLLHVSNFKGGTPEFIETSYAILVLVLPSSNSRVWTNQEIGIVEVVSDQVAVALSHASVLEESQLMRQKLEEKNRALQQSRQHAMMASLARKSFQTVMSHGMRRPMHSILGMLSLFQEEDNIMRSEQKIIGDTMLKVEKVLSRLINDVMEISENGKGGLWLEMKPFHLHSMLKEAACVAKCLCVYEGLGLEIDVQRTLPKQVIGDEARIFQVILHIIGYLLSLHDGGNLTFRVFLGGGDGDKDDRSFGMWRSNSQIEDVYIKFDFQIAGCSQSDESTSTNHCTGRRHYNNEPEEGLSFNMCKKLVQIMQGNIWISPTSQGLVQGITLLLKFQKGPSLVKSRYAPKDSSNSQFRGLKVLLADDDCVNRSVMKKLLEKLGCQVTAVSSGFECLSAIRGSGNSFRIILLDLHMPEMDGFEVAARIRNFNGPNWPLIVALIASAEEHVKEKCLLAGMNGLFRKPITLNEIVDGLRSVLQRAGEKL